MTLSEKVGQLFMTYIEGEEITIENENFLRESHLGGIIVYSFANKLDDPSQINNLCTQAQEISLDELGQPLLIAADQEGGKVQRLRTHFTLFPGNATLGEKDPSLTNDVYQAMGEEMLSVGVNMNLAPVVDPNNNPDNPVIGNRAFHSYPQEVAILGKKAIEGLDNAGVIPCIKHFPGHGDVTVDSHLALPVVMKQMNELEQMELFPFRSLVPYTPVIMTAHILYPFIDPSACATTSSYFMHKLLREELGFSGVVITDSLTMKGVLQMHGSIEEAAIEAFLAGCDILLIGNDKLIGNDGHLLTERDISHYDLVKKVIATFIKAIEEGRISEKRVDESLKRIIALKKRARISPVGNLPELVEKHKKLTELLL